MPTTIGILELVPTFECIGVYSNFSGDLGGNNKTTLEFRESGGLWLPGHPLEADRRPLVYGQIYVGPVTGGGSWASSAPNPYVNQHRGSIIGLNPDTEYDVRVTYTDPDGVIGGPSIVTTIRTRNDNVPFGTGAKLYVAPNGNDLNAGTEASPFRTIQRACEVASPGDTIIIRAGTHLDYIYPVMSGMADNYITFQPYGYGTADEEPVVLDNNNRGSTLETAGDDPLVVLDGISYNRFRGLDFVNSFRSLVMLKNFSNDNIIEDCRLLDYGYRNPDGGVNIVSGSARTLVQHNLFSTARATYGDAIHRTDGVVMWMGAGERLWSGPGEGTVIRHNTFESINGGMSDGVGGRDNANIIDGPYKDCDIYDNTTIGTRDDGFEPEGGDINVRVGANRINNPMTIGIGSAYIVVGPLYVFRNEIFNLARNQSGYKLGTPRLCDGFGRYYHNTLFTDEYAYGMADWGGPGWYNQVFLNNVVKVGAWLLVHNGDSRNLVLDYNCSYSPLTGDKWRLNGINYSSLAAFQAAGQELNGIFADPQFVNEAIGDLRLQETSPAANRGVVIPNFNDESSPWPFQGSAPDMGAIESGSTLIPPMADFSYSPSTGSAPLEVQFTNLSTGEIDDWNWDFGDGTLSSSEQNPSHIYETVGAYTVTLVVTGPGGSNARTVTDAIAVTSGPVTQYILDITVTAGGVVSVNPDLPAYDAGTSVELTAISDPGYRFVQWQENGAPFSYINPLTLTIWGDRAITAVFEPIPQYSLGVTVTTGGSVTLTPDLPTYDEGAEVVLTALPDTGYRFVEWVEGGISLSTTQQLQIIMNSNRSIVASFEEVVAPPDEWVVSVSSFGQGFTIPGEGTYTVTDGEEFSVFAEGHTGYKFAYWEGDVSGTENPLPLFPVTSNMSIIAVFIEKPSPGIPAIIPIGAAVILGIITSAVAFRRKKI